MASGKDLSNINPIKELKQTFKHHEIATIINLIFDVLIASFLTGTIYQYWLMFLGKRRKVIMMSSFRYGFSKCLIPTLFIIAILFYFYFKFLRMLNRGKKDYENGVEKSDRATFGSAHFQDEDERKKNFKMYSKIADTTDEILGIDPNGKYCSLKYPSGKNHNRLYCGSPGSGKTASIILTDIYQCMRRGQSVITTDSKGDLYKDTVAIAKKYNYKVKVLNLKTKELANSNGFNVMAELDEKSESFAAECSTIANIIISNTQGDDAVDYWAKNEAMALTMVIMELASNPSYIAAGQNNLYGVYEFISSKSSDEMKEIFTRHPQGTPIRMAYNNFSKASLQNQGQILNGLTSRLWMLNNPTLGKVLANNEIDLLAPMKQPCIYYVIIPDTETPYKFIASLFFSTIFAKQCEYSDSLSREEKKDQLEVYYELDEYKNIGGIVGLDTKMSTVRSRKMNITIILQLKNQLDIIHGENGAKEILNDCTVKGLLSTSDMDTAQYFSDLLGYFTAKTDGERYTEAKTNIFHLHGTINKNIGEQRRALRQPEELMNDNMDRNSVIYVIDNMAPAILNKPFAELGGKGIHFLYNQAQELAKQNGEKQSKNYRPAWRKREEELKDKMALKPIVKTAQNSDNTKEQAPKPQATTPPPSSPFKKIGNSFTQRAKTSIEMKPEPAAAVKPEVKNENEPEVRQESEVPKKVTANDLPKPIPESPEPSEAGIKFVFEKKTHPTQRKTVHDMRKMQQEEAENEDLLTPTDKKQSSFAEDDAKNISNDVKESQNEIEQNKESKNAVTENQSNQEVQEEPKNTGTEERKQEEITVPESKVDSPLPNGEENHQTLEPSDVRGMFFKGGTPFKEKQSSSIPRETEEERNKRLANMLQDDD